MHVGFDLDGVLLDSESDLAWLDRGLDSALDEIDVPATAEHRRRLYPGQVRNVQAVAADFGVDPDVLWEARTRHYTREKVAAIRSGEIGPFEDLDAIDRLDGPLFLISNSPREVVDAFLDVSGLEDRFAVAVGRGHALSDLADLKPATAFAEPVFEELGAGRYVYVGDAETDREFAEAAGMEYVHLDRAERTLRDVVRAVEAKG